MATIQRRKTKTGTVHYRAQVRIKGYAPASASFERVTDAKAWAGRTEADMKRGLYLPESEARRRTLGELLDRYTYLDPAKARFGGGVGCGGGTGSAIVGARRTSRAYIRPRHESCPKGP